MNQCTLVKYRALVFKIGTDAGTLQALTFTTHV